MLDLNRLRVLQEVARGGSFSAAARALHITPSAVSQQISALERGIGVPVVTRGARGVTLTDPGRLLVQAVDNLTGDLRHVERHLAAYADGDSGRLAIASFPSAGHSLLPLALAPLTRRPDVEVTVREAETEQAVPLLRAGEVDLALVYHNFTLDPPREWAADLHYTPVLHEEFFAVVPATHAFATRDRLRFGELADEWWVHGTGLFAAQIDAYCAAAGFRPKAACRSADTTFMQTMVAAGVGVAIMPAVAVARHLDGIVAVPIDEPPMRHVGVLHRRDRWQPPLAVELVELLGSTARALTVPGTRP
ncbi:LysR family transcriptional regulator [Pseudonocardia sp. TRM90224]|uniref:LysR family transcriptional regulator n=1 Tax=Pseudonocardia sp. TRM90224 TaxID=2812678 RepID=UPI001E2E6645|nr:LysR family transcriptional regulator [Pseudonocardia sp. TRM90224]